MQAQQHRHHVKGSRCVSGREVSGQWGGVAQQRMYQVLPTLPHTYLGNSHCVHQSWLHLPVPLLGSYQLRQYRVQAVLFVDTEVEVGPLKRGDPGAGVLWVQPQLPADLFLYLRGATERGRRDGDTLRSQEDAC